MKRSILYVCLTVVGLLAGACGGVDPTADCENACEAGKTGGCVPETTNCTTSCSGAETQYDDLRAQAMALGCTSQFDSYYACLVSAPACPADTPCEAELSAYTDCGVAFCTANPTDPACAAP